MRKPRAALQRQLLKTFVVQSLMITAVTALGIYVTNWLVSDVLMKEALQREAEHYWALLADDSNVAMANSLNLQGFYLPRDESGTPAYITDLDDGFHGLQGRKFNTYYVTSNDGNKLVLLFNRSQVDGLISLYGLIPLLLVLALLYIMTFISYRLARKAVSPMIALARAVGKLNPRQLADGRTAIARIAQDARDDEARVLAEAFDDYLERIERFVERERHFTRDASHELRTPITVITMACEMLESDPSLSDPARRSVNRIRRASRDMQELVSAFLALAREERDEAESEFNVFEVVEQEVAALSQFKSADTVVSVAGDRASRLIANEKIFVILVRNLLRNAMTYTPSGSITVNVSDTVLEIVDTGLGMDRDQIEQAFKPYVRLSDNARSGYGVGLSIVKRLVDHYHWVIEVDSEAGGGTRVLLRFTEGWKKGA